jgi:hypothetical protein
MMHTDEVVATLKTIPKDDPAIPRPSVKAINKIKKLLSDVELCRLPFPDVYATEHGVKLVWRSPSREIKLHVGQKGEMTFETAIKRYDEIGDLVDVVSSEGHLETASIDYVMAWFLTEQAAEA